MYGWPTACPTPSGACSALALARPAEAWNPLAWLCLCSLPLLFRLPALTTVIGCEPVPGLLRGTWSAHALPCWTPEMLDHGKQFLECQPVMPTCDSHSLQGP